MWPSDVVTPRLLLRLWHPDDAPALHDAITASLEHLRPWMVWVRFEPLSRDDRIGFIEAGRRAHEGGGDANYGVRVDGEVVGGCGLHRRQGPGVVDLGYWIHVDHIGRGYATELSRALTTVAFGDPDTERVEIHHDRANRRSAGVPRSLGFRRGPERPDGIDSPGEDGIDCTWWIDRAGWTGDG
ncbi:RimJ/RimL family protein N-acetyltransferase [Ilumatobacter fluminis]|uniref:RimJ/RimL family protein N-acetyltransferase n=1 Tax=Ilumatobacter fluminis TaxID=467091 RepID=A0A4V6Q1V4_9ACTN|nr:RimJ/RimL family protein N-acetyltransferase [Ilumatobacter fluminis]